ncbi:hypothetical protein GCM10010885_06030 [Alicyclobacillus cellulosilyticus]|uniref:Nickel/cobalt efflux system n=1 Tax=Alicyclobacillus cellulosilyticus TaxID=1003997 RepID=A0A917K3E9_9BACL|nr:hypothetical protein [Alicyclobacillus cellulosilyticus]GGI99554.1 hypothetical protein GCM10010885_06030 [Alicyclobacillus cellulosilyticus]
MHATELWGLFGLALALGIRHGIDWDHISAIADLVGSERQAKRGFLLATWYALGHEMVIVCFGGLAVLVGWTLPHWVDSVMERVVGLTLILLAGVFLAALFRRGQDYVMVSRWRLLYLGMYNAIAWLAERLLGRYVPRNTRLTLDVTWRGAFVIGIIHGVGAETPTQLLLFTTAAGVGDSVQGLLLVFLFAAGLLVSHSLLALMSLFGFAATLRKKTVMFGVGLSTAVYSLAVGLLFVTGQASWLPALA